jgi:hypothetical protein
MDGDWLTYARAAERLRTSSERSSALVINALEAHVETLKGQLTAAEARLAQHVADLTAEKARTEKAIEAFSALADRLDALAAERANPWWHRLLPRAETSQPGGPTGGC